MDNRAPTTRANSASLFSRFGELAAVFFKTKFSDGLPCCLREKARGASLLAE